MESKAERRIRQLEEENAKLRERYAESDLEKGRRLQRLEEETKKMLEQIQPSNLPEFLDACHKYLCRGFSHRVDHETGTKGPVENATSKLRPDHVKEWLDFPKEQSVVWKKLINGEFASKRHFTSLHTLKESGHEMGMRYIGSEQDLSMYERYAVEDRVSFVIRLLCTDSRLREKFKLEGEVLFENHGNTITKKGEEDVPALDPDIGPSDRSPVQKRRKNVDSSGLPATPPARSRSSRPRADQFCVYNAGPEGNLPAFIIEYKAPHKLTKDIVKAGLTDMELDEVVDYHKSSNAEKLASFRVAAVITQAFSYMVEAELEYGYICTGETFIFLRIPLDDPTTVYYYPSIPEDDVGGATGWEGDLSKDNNLHLTAVGQVLAFTLRALRSRPRGQEWRAGAEEQLERWELIPDAAIFDSDIEKKTGKKLADYKQTWASRDEYIRSSPVRTRSKGLPKTSCSENDDLPSHPETDDDADGDDDDDSSGNGGLHPSSPTAGLPRNSSNVMVIIPKKSSSSSASDAPTKTKRRSYVYNTGPFLKWCTQKCLLGLRTRGALDPKCPNVAIHRLQHASNHALNESEFRRMVYTQIVGKPGPWGCESMHRHGVSGALFWLILYPHGYTLVAKAMPVEMVPRALYEERLYRHLRAIQGVNIPVCLGSVDISTRPLWYDGICEVVHLLLIAHAGRPAEYYVRDAGPDPKPGYLKKLARSASESLRAMHELRVLHCDAHSGNMFWNAENRRVMFIDLERALVVDDEPREGETRKRKRGTLPHTKSVEFERERSAVASTSFRR